MGAITAAAMLVAAASLGCRFEKSNGTASETEEPAPAAPAAPLRLIVVDDPTLADAISRQWSARADRELTVRNVSSDELLSGEQLNTDVVVYPSALLGELAERHWIVEFPEESLAAPENDRSEIFLQARLREPVWGESVMAVSFGSPQFVLAYRKDLFERLALSPPTTWAEYEACRAKLSDRAALGELAPAEDQPWLGTAEPLAEQWQGTLLLARGAAYLRHPEQFSALFNMRSPSLEPLIDGEPLVRAMKELKDAAASNNGTAVGLTPEQAFDRLLAGEAGMAITWPRPADRHADSEKERDVESENLRKADEPETNGGAKGAEDPPAGVEFAGSETSGEATSTSKGSMSIGFVELPGSRDVFDSREKRWEPRDADSAHVPLIGIAGRLGSVSALSRDPRAAANLLIWLTEADVRKMVSPASRETTIFRDSQVAVADRWTPKLLSEEAVAEYAAVCQASQNRSWTLDALRIPGRTRYMASLDTAVRRVLAGEASAEESLATAADEWRAVTQELGVEAQRRAYRHSLGLPTP